MKVFRGVVFGITIAFCIFAILALIIASNLAMCFAVIVGSIIVAVLNIISTIFWWREKMLVLLEMKWAGIKLNLK